MKAQLQTMEPIIIVIFLTIIGVIGLVFVLRIGAVEQTIEVERIQELQSVELLKLTTTMPELSCSKSVTTDTFCIDLYKAREFSKLMRTDTNRIYYFPLFGTAEIKLEYVDVFSRRMYDIVLYDSLSNDSDVRATSTHFTVYNPLTKERLMAVMTVRRGS